MPPQAGGSQKPNQVVIKDFTGLFTNYDPADIQVGAARDQVNVIGEKVGSFQVRAGYVRVKVRS